MKKTAEWPCEDANKVTRNQKFRNMTEMCFGNLWGRRSRENKIIDQLNERKWEIIRPKHYRKMPAQCRKEMKDTDCVKDGHCRKRERRMNFFFHGDSSLTVKIEITVMCHDLTERTLKWVYFSLSHWHYLAFRKYSSVFKFCNSDAQLLALSTGRARNRRVSRETFFEGVSEKYNHH